VLLWADSATGPTCGGDRSSRVWSTKAQVLQKMGHGPEAAAVMQKALPVGNMNEGHQYAKQLVGLKYCKMSFDAFKTNYDKYPNQFTTMVGLTRAYSAIGDFKNALKYAQLALPLASDQQNRNTIEMFIQKLKEGKNVD
jgi:tetratricopeptide (TPR) repeat protein